MIKRKLRRSILKHWRWQYSKSVWRRRRRWWWLWRGCRHSHDLLTFIFTAHSGSVVAA